MSRDDFAELFMIVARIAGAAILITAFVVVVMYLNRCARRIEDRILDDRECKDRQ